MIAAAACAAPPQRIISIAPSATEILYGLGVFDRVVAVSDYCTYPPEVNRLPRVGGWTTPSLEKLLSLHPDLVVLSSAQQAFIQDSLQKLGVATQVAPSLTVADVFTAIDALGRATGREGAARQLAASTRAALDRVRTRAQGLPKPGVLCIVDRTPGTLRDLYAATGGGYLAELIEIAGGRVLAPRSREGYVRLDQETMLASNPDIVIDMVQGARGKLAEDPQAVWREFPELKAVRAHRVYPVRDEAVLHASQRIAGTAVKLARLIHPEVPAGDWGSE